VIGSALQPSAVLAKTKNWMIGAQPAVGSRVAAFLVPVPD
jgi:hypothetical protein